MNYSLFGFKSIIIALNFIALVFCSCADIGTPPGGPEDKTAPEIFYVKPEAGSVKVPVDTEFEIRFSKNMDKTNTEKAVFISPLFFNYPKFEWSGKKLKVIPPENLRENTTYVLTIGALARDSRRNEMGESKSYSFSTGDKIYECSIFGEVLGKNMRNLNVWAYKLESENPDTFWMKLPDYITQPDSLGKYKFEYLSYGTYLVVAVEDNNNDQFWAPPGERLALPDKMVYLSEDKQEFGPLVMMTTERDTIQPYISSASSSDNKSVIVKFSQAVDTSLALIPINYTIHPPDSLEYPVVIKDVVPLSGDFKSFYISVSEMNSEAKYKVISRNIQSPYGISADTVSRFIQAGPIDTLRPEMLKLLPPPSRTPRPTGFELEIIFSEPMDTAGFNNKIAFTDTLDNPIEFLYNWRYTNMLIVTPDFDENERYYFSYDERVITDLAGNLLGDSLKVYDYTTASPDSFGQIIGKIANGPGEDIIVLVESKKDGKVFSEKTNPYGEFYIDRLFAGAYKVQAFYDNNSNGKFDGGSIRPFTFAEPIALYADTVSVRARWETDIGVLDFQPQRIDVDTLQ